MNTKRFAGLGVATLLAVAACGSDDSSDTDATSADTAATTAAAPTSAAPTTTAAEEGGSTAAGAADGDAVVATAESDLGTILVDAEGRTLYAFTPDTEGEPTCVEACAEAWPPAFVEGELAVGDLDAAAFTLVEHPAGGQQLKAGDWPLYLFAGDAAPGDVNGQGVGGNWFVVTPDGTLIEQ
ncbi:MAG: COG4315 family predicted lipoprotein [Ilumatobacteraceae bacterium]